MLGEFLWIVLAIAITAAVIGLIMWILNYFPIPQPMLNIVKGCVALVFVIILIILLVQMFNGGVAFPHALR